MDDMTKHPKRKDRPGVDRYGRTELHYAAFEGDVGKIKALLSGGMNAGASDDDGLTPLHAAVKSGSLPSCAALLKADAPVDARDANGNTPLSTAVFESRGRGDIIRLLREHGADPTIKNNYGVSPLGLARSIANFDVRRFFADLPASE